MSQAPRHPDVAAFLSAEMTAKLSDPACTKRSAARLSIVKAIAAGILRRGDLLPPEKHLADVLKVSLGTVQAALQQLQQTGIIIRRRGDGTRIASIEPMAEDVWHFRFLSKSNGLPLRMIGADVDIERVVGSGAWSSFLGEDSAYIRIRRRIQLQDNVRVAADMYLCRKKAPALEFVPPSELRLVNIRPYLEKQHGVITGWADHVIEARTFNDGEASSYGLKAGGTVFEIRANAHAPDRSPVYFQRILAPTAECNLSF